MKTYQIVAAAALAAATDLAHVALACRRAAMSRSLISRAGENPWQM
jgi:hypothetical protein